MFKAKNFVEEIVAEELLNGDISYYESIHFFEASVNAGDIDGFTSTPAYRTLVKLSDKLLKIVDDDREYADKVLATGKPDYFLDEVENYEYVVGFLSSLKLNGFDKDTEGKVNDLLNTAKKSLRAASTGGKSLVNKYIKDGEWNQETTGGKPPKSMLPLVYTKKTVKLLDDYMSLLGVEWDYPAWYTNAPERAKRLGSDTLSDYLPRDVLLRDKRGNRKSSAKESFTFLDSAYLANYIEDCDSKSELMTLKCILEQRLAHLEE